MATDRDLMMSIAAAVADGSAIDWDGAETRATTDADKRVLRSLRLIAEIGSVHDSAEPDLDGSTDDETGAEAAGVPLAAAAPTDRWGNYELREQLGAGAQGTVYRAWDPQLECEVAVKVLQPRLATADRVGERMLREGRALAKVRHQNVVDVYAAEAHEGQVGLCMEFIRGRTLEQVLTAQGPFGSGEAATIGLKVGRALAAVHAAGIVHRDVKARNVMREDGGRVVLMDFGAGRDGAQLAASGGGDLAGTPMYMAPEVLTGSAATQQSDIYSVGVLLYYLVSGQYPVEGRTLDELIQAHVRGRRKPLAERRPDIQDAFIRIVDKALAPDPDTRYETAAMLVHDLASIEADETERVLPPRTVTQRVLLGAAWLAMGALGIMLLGFLSSMAFNIALERSVAIAGEGPWQWLVWGVRGLVGPIANLAQAVIEVLVAVAVWRLLRRFLPKFDRASGRFVARVSKLWRSAGLADVDTFGQVMFVLAVVYLVTVVLLYSPLISAMMSSVSSMTADQRLLLSPANEDLHSSYRSRLDVLLVLAGIAAFRLTRMRRRQPTAVSAALVTALLAVLVLAAIMWAAPYRLLFQSERAVVGLAGQRCYDLGHELASTLVYCPDAPQVKVQRIPDGDPRLTDEKVTESVFATH